MNIFLTGGSGFIGRNIIESFSAKHNIIAPSHKELELTDEYQVKDFFNKHDIDIVIHSAVKPGHRNASDQSGQLYSNLRMFYSLARNSHKFKKMIFISSGLTYDKRHYQPKMKEEYFDTHMPADDGGFSKYISAKYTELANNIVELRIFGVFGKYEDYAIRFISNAICKTLFDLPITIRQDRKFDYIYIDDLMPILEYFMYNKSSHKCYNVTPNESISLKILAEKVCRISGKDLPVHIAQAGMGPEYSGDNTKLKNEIGNLDLLSIDESISRLYDWYKENKSSINKEFLLVDK